jgi:hypothetical protein
MAIIRSAKAPYQICDAPPSTYSSTPFTKLESSEARNRAAVAISSGRSLACACDNDDHVFNSRHEIPLTVPFFARGPSHFAKLNWKQPRFFEYQMMSSETYSGLMDLMSRAKEYRAGDYFNSTRAECRRLAAVPLRCARRS